MAASISSERFFYSLSIRQLQELIQKKAPREEIVASYKTLTPFVQQMIKNSMCYISHESVSTIVAEKIITGSSSEPVSSEEAFHIEQNQDFGKPYNLFELAINHLLDTVLPCQMQSIQALKNLLLLIDQKADHRELAAAYCNLSLWAEVQLAAKIYGELSSNTSIEQVDIRKLQEVRDFARSAVLEGAEPAFSELLRSWIQCVMLYTSHDFARAGNARFQRGSLQVVSG